MLGRAERVLGHVSARYAQIVAQSAKSESDRHGDAACSHATDNDRRPEKTLTKAEWTMHNAGQSA